MAETHYTFCRICEATCGLEVDVDTAANRIADIRPDTEHVASRGYACVKGTRYASVQHSPDRVLEPQQRTGSSWSAVSWDVALGDAARDPQA